MIRDIHFPFPPLFGFFCGLIIFHFLSFSRLSPSPSPSPVSTRLYHHHHACTLTSSSSSFHLLLLLQLLSSHLQVANADLQTESEALLRFFHNLQSPSPSSAKSLNWTNTTSACSWVGVQCSADGNGQTQTVVSVALPGRGLVGSIPPQSFGLLPSLQTLSLRSNRLTGTIPADILSYSKLKQLCESMITPLIRLYP